MILIKRKFVIDGMGLDEKEPVYFITVTTMFETMQQALEAKVELEQAYDIGFNELSGNKQ